LLVALAHPLGQLADLLGEPEEVLVETALLIPAVVRPVDQILELRECHGVSGGATAPRPFSRVAPGAGRRPCRRRSERTRGRACGRLYRPGLRPSIGRRPTPPLPSARPRRHS